MLRHKFIALLGTIILLTGCIQTSSEPDIVATQVVPDPSPTSMATSTTTTLETPAIASPTPALAAETDTETPATINAQGIIRNGTTNTRLGEPLEVLAQLITGFPDAPTITYEQEIITTETGEFTLEDIPFSFGILTLTTTFDSIEQSAVFPVSTNAVPAGPIDVGFAVYAKGNTQDVVVQTLEITAEPSVSRERLLVTQVVEVRNNGLGIIPPGNNGSFSIPLPANAQNIDLVLPPALSLQPAVLGTILTNLDNPSGIITLATEEDLPVYQGQIPLLPGESNVAFFVITYDLPFLGTTEVVQNLEHTVESLTVFVPAESEIVVRSDQLAAFATTQRTDPPVEGYPAIAPLSADSQLQFTITQQPTSNAPNASLTTESDEAFEDDSDLVSILMLLTGVLLIVTGGLYVAFDIQRRGQKQQVAKIQNRTQQRDDLLDAILELDELYEASKITAEEYQEKRTTLKIKLNRYLDVD